MVDATNTAMIFLRKAPIVGCMIILGCIAKDPDRVQAINIIQYGIMEYRGAVAENDKTSSIGAEITRAPEIKIAIPTSRIPLREGLSYGIAFVVEGPAASQPIPVNVILRSSHPCVLRTTGAVVYQNDTVLNVRVGIPRYIGGRIVNGKESPCVGPSVPGIATFEIYYAGKKYAEQKFLIVSDGNTM